MNAGGNQTVSLLTGADLAGTVTDDGLPNPPGVVTATWSQGVRPRSDDIRKIQTARPRTRRFLSTEFMFLRLTASDGELSSSDDAQIVVMPVVSENTTSSSIVIQNNEYVEGKTGPVRFLNLPPKSNIKVIDRTGVEVADLNGSGTIEWSATNRSGSTLPSGTYFAIINGDNGTHNKGRKIVVIRR